MYFQNFIHIVCPFSPFWRMLKCAAMRWPPPPPHWGLRRAGGLSRPRKGRNINHRSARHAPGGEKAWLLRLWSSNIWNWRAARTANKPQVNFWQINQIQILFVFQMNEYSDDHLNVHIAFRKKICFVWLISSALLEMNIDFQFPP